MKVFLVTLCIVNLISNTLALTYQNVYYHSAKQSAWKMEIVVSNPSLYYDYILSYTYTMEASHGGNWGCPTRSDEYPVEITYLLPGHTNTSTAYLATYTPWDPLIAGDCEGLSGWEFYKTKTPITDTIYIPNSFSDEPINFTITAPERGAWGGIEAVPSMKEVLLKGIKNPTAAPTTAIPSISPTNKPSISPSKNPSLPPTQNPSTSPTKSPSKSPTTPFSIISTDRSDNKSNT